MMENKNPAFAEFVESFNAIAEVMAEDSAKQGFNEHYDNPLYIPTKIMLVVTELAEGIEGHRKGEKDQHLPKYESLTVEMADAVIRLMTLAGEGRIPLAQAIIDKMQFNRTRPFKHGGKKY
jgi:NTP pyrophosphatase (non-canonical NTP hydrolase)